MFLLKNTLTTEDFKFAGALLNKLLKEREMDLSGKLDSKISEKDPKSYDKTVVSLSENEQPEAVEIYCNKLSPVSTMNSKIVSFIHKLEAKAVKEARECMALFAYYKWNVSSQLFQKNLRKDDIKTNNEKNIKSTNTEKADYGKSFFEEYPISLFENDNSDNYSFIESLEVYKKAKYYYNTAYKLLYDRSKTDPIANESAFLMKKQNLSTEEFLRTLSNLRNQILSWAGHQVNKDLTIKLKIAYAINLLRYASKNELLSKLDFVKNIIADLQSRIAKSIVPTEPKINF